MKTKKLFGTDGIRGTANQYPMTPEMVLQVGRALAYRIKQRGHYHKAAKVLIGKDTRLSGYMIEQALSSGLCSMGANVLLVGPLPTPGIAFLTHNMRADAGVVISASHNLFPDNGIKIFERDGFKCSVQEEKEIEKLVDQKDLLAHLPTAENVGRTTRIEDAIGRYVVYVKNTFPKNLTLEGMRIVLDCANGAAYKVAPWVFEEFGAEVIKLGVSPNGTNINDKCGALHPHAVAEATLRYRADIGISLDGDADRVILSDEKGQIVNGDHILAICAMDMKEKNQLENNSVVATHMSNFGLEQYFKKIGVNLIYTDVGDKYVVEAMKNQGHVLGGEQSGHIVFLEHSTTGDGMIAALRILSVMVQRKQKLSDLKAIMTDVPQVLRNVRVKRQESVKNIKGLKACLDDVEARLNGQGRVFVRSSGTEPVVRVLVEGLDRDLINQAAEEISQIIVRELS